MTDRLRGSEHFVSQRGKNLVYLWGLFQITKTNDGIVPKIQCLVNGLIRANGSIENKNRPLWGGAFAGEVQILELLVTRHFGEITEPGWDFQRIVLVQEFGFQKCEFFQFPG